MTDGPREMRIDVVTLFPEMVTQACGYGITGRARERGLWQLGVFNPRDFATDAYRTIDDRPYGGGPGMVLMAGPLARALEAAREAQSVAGVARGRTLYLSPAGSPLTHRTVMDLVADPGHGVTLLAGRYEGVDQRLLDREVDCEVSVGDFVVSGGELPALLLIDAIVRQLPSALNDAESARQDSFADGLLDCPHYTRPERYDGERVPEVLLSGDHAAIRRWRLKQAVGRTWQWRPDLLDRRPLAPDEQTLLSEYQVELTDN
ncbi:MAG: tRNA (guanosine(37)-N1)-methyltransferase TrmD [Pseudomonadota bacterium]|nr:tRNA (guanosine(37)-N1)-methyltransferase TrmD [Pseudomonadota bacterium]